MFTIMSWAHFSRGLPTACLRASPRPKSYTEGPMDPHPTTASSQQGLAGLLGCSSVHRLRPPRICFLSVLIGPPTPCPLRTESPNWKHVGLSGKPEVEKTPTRRGCREPGCSHSLSAPSPKSLVNYEAGNTSCQGRRHPNQVPGPGITHGGLACVSPGWTCALTKRLSQV